DDDDDAGRLGNCEVVVGTGDRIDGSDDLRVFVAPAGVVNPPIDDGVDFLARVDGRNALTPELIRQLRRARLANLGNPIKDLTAVVRRFVAPGCECFTRRLDGIAKIFSRSAASVGEQIASLAVLHGVETTRFRAGKFAADVE